ncbi:hypothetical protein [Pseudonocardia sp. D17]|uniref:hypothetical protein n=1 Tax=Pseudonocardia sp. D17 TaxID=882661 RepID=UPI0030CBCC36
MQSITLGDGTQSFADVAFDSAMPKMAFQTKEDRDAGRPRTQDKNNDGVNKWQVRLNVTYRDTNRGDFILVSVASNDDPSQRFARGDVVSFDNLRVGANGYRERAGFSWFYFADAVHPAAVAAKS